VLLSELKRLVNALAQHEELNRRVKVSQFEKKLCDQFCSLRASRLFHDPDGGLGVVEMVQVNADGAVKVAGGGVGGNRVPVWLLATVGRAYCSTIINGLQGIQRFD
jgi:hypothetical protein